MNVELIAIQPGAHDKSKLVERAARICYRSKPASTDEGRLNFLRKLAKRKHLSVFEHARYVTTFEGYDPYLTYWPVRYGANITKEPHGGGYIVSFNARNQIELTGENLVLNPDKINGILLPYDELTDNEKLYHASATFEVSHFARISSQQVTRHRLASISQESQRYVESGALDNTAGRFDFIMPPDIANDSEAGGVFDSFMYDIWRVYKQLRAQGGRKEDARFILPNAVATRLAMTQNFHAWLHFCEVRCDKAAQWEIREMAVEILRQLNEIAPGVFGELWGRV